MIKLCETIKLSLRKKNALKGFAATEFFKVIKHVSLCLNTGKRCGGIMFPDCLFVPLL